MSHKFVLLRNGQLFVADGLDNYHQEMTHNAPRSEVKAAGWVKGNAQDGFMCYASSIGYRIAFTSADEAVVDKTLKQNGVVLNAMHRYHVARYQTT